MANKKKYQATSTKAGLCPIELPAHVGRGAGARMDWGEGREDAGERGEAGVLGAGAPSTGAAMGSRAGEAGEGG